MDDLVGLPEPQHPIDTCDVCPNCGAKGRCYDEQPIYGNADNDQLHIQVGVWAGFKCDCGQTWGVSEIAGNVEIVKGRKY